MIKEDCSAIATGCRSAWQHIKPMLPTAAGRVGFEQAAELGLLYGGDVVFILGSRIRRDPQGLIEAIQRFIKEVERCTGK
jgi:ribulose-bisphosphate carboxylase large chain